MSERQWTDARSKTLFDEHHARNTVRTDRLFLVLLVVQWAAALVAALWISPLAWAGAPSRVQTHVWQALFLGGSVTALPVALILLRPGSTLTRHVVAISQMLMSGLLIQ